ncbi:SDR family oxidoreductase [Abyssibacter sp.]|jgi:NAD(P)-dependent dehydrogenase (short-subunit alcohol dehydrogenase family)|uniref:SDR family NAD(P)-dependent oxidoreductase n=1 Tax=Abyssibacter sp. TaxID=2320200 RepID=UPI0025BEE056|nr:SDR family oxidoreductase [Abyssibacter sp.]MCK5860736.1 SDR family oxidoreductase [Abyssibacter sp.]
MKQFKNKVAAITGAGSGIGRALALNLAQAGCDLAISDINGDNLAETAKLAEAAGARVTTTSLDVADRDAVYAWADDVVQQHGRVNLLFNNAGVAHAAAAETASLEDFHWLMNINFWGVVHGTQAFLPHLRASGEGHIVNVSSLFGLIGMPTQATYCAAKFAVRGYTETLRMELDMEGAPVSATCVHPGGVATGINQSSRIDSSVEKLTGVSLDSHKRRAEKMIQTTTPERAAQIILDAVKRDARRVVVGPDARAIDKLARLLGSGYQALVLRRYPHKKAPAQAQVEQSNGI